MSPTGARLRRWQGITLSTLTGGYIAYYFCRSNLAVASPLLLEEFGPAGLDKTKLGAIVSAGVLLYAVGKLVMGTLTDFVGGRGVFFGGLLASAAATVFFGFGSGAGAFTLAWALNRFFQSGGWGALVKVASHWYAPRRLGTVMGVLALSYPLGDFFAKLSLGTAIAHGAGWRHVFFAAAGVAAVTSIGVRALLRESPRDVGEAEPPTAERSVYGDRASDSRPASLRALLGPLVRSPAFLCVCAMSFGLTVIRETFSFWTPVYLVETTGASSGTAAQLASAFPLFGGVSVLAAGYASDRFAGGRRAGVMIVFLVVSTLGILALALAPSWPTPAVPVACIALIGAAMTGPYAFLSGAVAIDLGGRLGSSTAAGLADAVGYVGGALAGVVVGGLAERFGWSAAFFLLAALSTLTVVAAVGYRLLHERIAPGHTVVRAP
ncbi:MAG: MFS transporter [Polyangiales bacterium]|nr:MFS transporter [Myxococcales bacterium]